MGTILKKYEELTFSDDFMFCKILENNLELCKELLELILDIKIKKIQPVESQKAVDMTYDGKGVRFDVYTQDEENTIYDVEMQNVTKKNLPKRTRYYQGMIDLNLIEKGADYSELKKTYIIFICKEVRFEGNLPVYTFVNTCQQDTSIKLNDDAIKVIINASGSRVGLSPQMCAFLDYVKDNKANSEFTRQLKEAIDEAIKNRKWRVDYMTLEMKIREERAQAKEEGREEGRKEGREEGRKEGREEGREEGRKEGREEGRKEGYEEIIKAMLIKGKTIEEISDICDLDLGLVKEIAKRSK